MGGLIAIAVGAFVIYSIQQSKKNAAIEATNKLIQKYGRDAGIAISQKQVKIGFSAEMLFEAWGRPDYKEVKETTTSKKIKLYFGAYVNSRGNTKYTKYATVENGIVINWGDIKR